MISLAEVGILVTPSTYRGPFGTKTLPRTLSVTAVKKADLNEIRTQRLWIVAYLYMARVINDSGVGDSLRFK